MTYDKIKVPAQGEAITVAADLSLRVPDNPIIPFIEGDGIGVDVTPPMIRVVDAAVQKAYGNKRKIAWMEVYAGEKATKVYGGDQWLPKETLDAMKKYVVSIKGYFNYPRWWWYTFIECGYSPGHGSLCLFTSNSLF